MSFDVQGQRQLLYVHGILHPWKKCFTGHEKEDAYVGDNRELSSVTESLSGP